jgi:hypothetical protein
LVGPKTDRSRLFGQDRQLPRESEGRRVSRAKPRRPPGHVSKSLGSRPPERELTRPAHELKLDGALLRNHGYPLRRVPKCSGCTWFAPCQRCTLHRACLRSTHSYNLNRDATSTEASPPAPVSGDPKHLKRSLSMRGGRRCRGPGKTPPHRARGVNRQGIVQSKGAIGARSPRRRICGWRRSWSPAAARARSRPAPYRSRR